MNGLSYFVYFAVSLRYLMAMDKEKVSFLQRMTVDIPATSRLLRHMRLEHGYTVMELAELLGLESRTAVYSWENESLKNIPSLDNLDFLARLYGVGVEDLYVMRPVDDHDIYIWESEPEYCLMPGEELLSLAL